ncbi:helix-turn-helix transcriptional regulator [Xylanimonas protaetiae]|uniref:helix-turn-helix transcriptional regulator n=1 Tax=Xylanimonas protaetiae TaxID=2509457 RepID=UPI0013EDA7AB|nr:LuxR family transcriptional regulator [Xylanimonas protaetiae]
MTLPGILGRDPELARLDDLVAGRGRGALLVLGDPGSGKTTLLEHAAAAARAQGQRVLVATGTAQEHDADHACLHRVLRPLLGRVAALPAGQRAAVESAFGLTDAPPDAGGDALRLALGVLTLLSDAAEDARVLVVVDDLHWADAASVRILDFVAARLEGERVALLGAARPTARDTHHVATIELGPLAPEAARAVIDLLPDAPRGEHRRRVLAHAEGNPLALVELTRAGSLPVDDAAPAPLTARLERAFAARTQLLPARTREALLLAAAAGPDDLAAVVAHQDLADWAPAEVAGLVRVGGAAPLAFRHSLVRSAVYQGATGVERAAVHRRLATLVAADPDRFAWHTAAATAGPDAEVAALLDSTAERARARGGWAGAARALERAAQLTADPAAATERLVRAATAAMYAGQHRWVEDLMAAARPLAVGPQRSLVDSLSAWALSQTFRHADAVDLALSAVREPVAGLGPLVSAAVAAYQAGDPRLAARTARALDDLAPGADDPAALWIRASTDPLGQAVPTGAAIDALLAAVDGVAARLGHLALNATSGTAYVVDHPRAVDITAAFLHLLGQPGTSGVNALVANTAGAVLVDAGRWDEAWSRMTEAVSVAEATGGELVARQAGANLAHLAALRGDPEAADLATRALAGVDPDVTRAVGVRARWALGLAAAGAGDWERAYQHLRLLLDDGRPAHPHLALYALPDLVAAALRTGRPAEARAAAHALGTAVGPGTSVRLHALAAHAAGLVAPDGAAERLFRAALDGLHGEPFERARARADLGAWLRRRRRISEAREELALAAETAARLGARPLAAFVAGELRAAGVREADAAPDALEDLSAQQRQIVRMAASGLTNRQIGERLYLSPRTVGFHLHQVFPRLGVTSRTQLRDVVGARPVT